MAAVSMNRSVLIKWKERSDVPRVARGIDEPIGPLLPYRILRDFSPYAIFQQEVDSRDDNNSVSQNGYG